MRRHIVCLGDSNTHGYCSDPTDCADGALGRFNEDERWPCLLQKALGENYLVIEEGLSGRTTVFDDPVHEGYSALPYLYSGGANTYLDELITTCGAVNVLGDQDGWVSVEAESAVALNPDVILTNVNYTDDAVGEILGREGWENVTAVKNKAVYYIDNLASSLPNNHLTDALVAVALAVYPDEFASLVEVEPAA